jgi:hypothetical protein
LKSACDLADRLRTAENILRQDLEAQHFSGADSDTGGDSPGPLRVSDLRFDLTGVNTKRPVGGYFNITHGANGAFEGVDQDNLSSTRATDHTLSMTIIRSGTTPADYFTNASDTVKSRAAEVIWTLGTPATVGGVQTFALYRGQRVLDDPINPPTVSSGYTLKSVQASGNRLQASAITTSDFIVLTNVLSFEVKPTWEGGILPRTNTRFFTNGRLNSDFPFDSFPPTNSAPPYPSYAVGGSFDTQNPMTNPNMRVNAVLIKIRLFDPKNKMTRQSSFIVKM